MVRHTSNDGCHSEAEPNNLSLIRPDASPSASLRVSMTTPQTICDEKSGIFLPINVNCTCRESTIAKGEINCLRQSNNV